MEFTSQTTFLYFEDMARARYFFDEVLGLEVVYDPVWCCVWRIGAGAFLGAVDVRRGAIPVSHRGGALISLTVRGIDSVYQALNKRVNLVEVTPLTYKNDIGLWSFLITGPEGYIFEIQEFTTQELRGVF